jgi:hypothetical protein
VPRYVFTKLIRCRRARTQEQIWVDHVEKRFACQTVRTVCRIPRVYRFVEARNARSFTFDDYLAQLSEQEQQARRMVVSAMKVLLIVVLRPKRVAGLGGFVECQGCRCVGSASNNIRHRNCLWAILGNDPPFFQTHFCKS